MADACFDETTTLGVRLQQVLRAVLDRSLETVCDKGFATRVKVETRQDGHCTTMAEIADLAQTTGGRTRRSRSEAIRPRAVEGGEDRKMTLARGITGAAGDTAALENALAKVMNVLAGLDEAAVAVSGGVDSMTLAALAQRALGARSEMFHAVSPAVPPEATERVRRYASRFAWNLRVVQAGEFDDPDYMRNPLNRCYFCKTNLYETICCHTDAAVLSGANTDDLSEYRPGLDAAAEHGVRHPYLEAGIGKRTVRRLASYFGFVDLAELPAAPCLSSRVETGIAIQADILGLIHFTEVMVRDRLQPDVVRCRVREDRIVIELDARHLESLSPVDRSEITEETAALFHMAEHRHPVEFAAYRTGSAFVAKAAS